MAYITFARNEAIQRSIPVVLNYSAGTDEYWFSVADTDGDLGGGFDDPFLTEQKHLPQGVTFLSPIRSESNLRTYSIVFQPTGVAAPQEEIHLTDHAERRARVVIGPWVDDVRAELSIGSNTGQ